MMMLEEEIYNRIHQYIDDIVHRCQKGECADCPAYNAVANECTVERGYTPPKLRFKENKGEQK